MRLNTDSKPPQTGFLKLVLNPVEDGYLAYPQLLPQVNAKHMLGYISKPHSHRSAPKASFDTGLTAVRRVLKSCSYFLNFYLYVSGVLREVAPLGCLGSGKLWSPNCLAVFYCWNLTFNGKEVFESMTESMCCKVWGSSVIPSSAKPHNRKNEKHNFINQPNAQSFLFTTKSI